MGTVVLTGIACLVCGALFWLRWLEERDLRETWRLFGTTGFYDMDCRFIREENDRAYLAYLKRLSTTHADR